MTDVTVSAVEMIKFFFDMKGPCDGRSVSSFIMREQNRLQLPREVPSQPLLEDKYRPAVWEDSWYERASLEFDCCFKGIPISAKNPRFDETTKLIGEDRVVKLVPISSRWLMGSN